MALDGKVLLVKDSASFSGLGLRSASDSRSYFFWKDDHDLKGRLPERFEVDRK